MGQFAQPPGMSSAQACERDLKQRNGSMMVILGAVRDQESTEIAKVQDKISET